MYNGNRVITPMNVNVKSGWQKLSLGEKQLIISLIVLFSVSIVVTFLLIFVFLKNDETEVVTSVTTSVTVTTSVVPKTFKDLTITANVDDSDICVGFNSTTFEFTHGDCENVPNNGDWEYEETTKSLVNFSTYFDKFLCLHIPISEVNSSIIGTPIINMENLCANVIIDNNTINYNNNEKCIVFENDTFSWGSCTDAFIFDIS